MKTFDNLHIKPLGIAFIALSASALGACSASQPSTATAASSCTPGTAMDETIAAFYEPGNVVAAKPIKRQVFTARALQSDKTMGASLYVKAEPAMNGPYLRRVLSCHARSGQSAHPNDPLHPAGGAIAKLTVREAGSHFAVDIEASAPSVGKEIWQRADALGQSSGSVEIEQVSQTEHMRTF